MLHTCASILIVAIKEADGDHMSAGLFGVAPKETTPSAQLLPLWPAATASEQLQVDVLLGSLEDN